MSNGRITYKEIYAMFEKVTKVVTRCDKQIAVIMTKQKDMSKDISGLKKTVNKQAEHIFNHEGAIEGNRGKLVVWGVLGGAAISFIIGLVILLARHALGF